MLIVRAFPQITQAFPSGLVNESYKILGDRSDLYYDRPFNMEEVVVTGYGSARYNSQRNSSTINLEKLHLSKTVIAKFEIN